MRHIKYYSFTTGRHSALASEWYFDDIKLAGLDLKSAIINYIWIRYQWNYKARISFQSVFLVIRSVTEFERKNQVGLTRVNFKKTQFYTQHQIMELFDVKSGIKIEGKI